MNATTLPLEECANRLKCAKDLVYCFGEMLRTSCDAAKDYANAAIGISLLLEYMEREAVQAVETAIRHK